MRAFCIGRSSACRWSSSVRPAHGAASLRRTGTGSRRRPARELRAIAARRRCHAAPPIEWRVSNPFRFFSNPRDTEVHRATWISSDARAAPDAGAERGARVGLAAPRRVGRPPRRQTLLEPYGPTAMFARRQALHAAGSHLIVAELKGFPDADRLSCTWLTAPKAKRPERGRRSGSAATSRSSFRLRFPGCALIVEIGEASSPPRRSESAMSSLSAWATVSARRRQSGCARALLAERAADYGKPTNRARARRLSGPPRQLAALSATRLSWTRTRAGSIRPVTARSTPIRCAPPFSSRWRIRTAP